MPQGVTGFERTYPHIARWVQSYGWIEIGTYQHYTSVYLLPYTKNSAPTDSRELSSRAMACQGFTGIACVMVIHYYLQFSFYYNTKIANQ